MGRRTRDDEFEPRRPERLAAAERRLAALLESCPDPAAVERAEQLRHFSELSPESARLVRGLRRYERLRAVAVGALRRGW